jgi:hypothetical protein
MRIEDLKKHLQDLQRQADQIEVEENYIKKELKRKFECESVEEAQELLEVLISEHEEAIETRNKKQMELVEKMKKDNLI